MKYNMIWDGAFHAVAWAITLAGIWLLFAERHTRGAWSARVFGGAMLAGWGLFDLVEGLIDHEMLGIHHVHPGAHELAWDLGFLALAGMGFLLAGLALVRSSQHVDHELADHG